MQTQHTQELNTRPFPDNTRPLPNRYSCRSGRGDQALATTVGWCLPKRLDSHKGGPDKRAKALLTAIVLKIVAIDCLDLNCNLKTQHTHTHTEDTHKHQRGAGTIQHSP